MRHRKRFTIIRIGLALTALAVTLPVTAQAKPLPSQPRAWGPMPTNQIQVDASDFGATLSPDDRAVSRMSGPQVEIPYLRHITAADLGIAPSAASPGVRGEAMKSRAATSRPSVDATLVASDDSWSIDVNPYTVTGFGLALLLVMGTGLAIRQSRKGRLSPA